MFSINDSESVSSEHSVASHSATSEKEMNININNNNNNSIINNNNNNKNSIDTTHSPSHYNNVMNTTAMLMHHQQQQQQQAAAAAAVAVQHQQAAAAVAQQQQQQQQQQNGGRDGSSSSRGAVDERTNGRGRGSSCSPASSPTRHPSAVSPVTSLNHSMMAQMAAVQQHAHQLSPPPHVGGVANSNGLPAGLPPRMPHGLPPHSLGLLNSLQMMHHASPLELMAVAHHHVPPRSYNSPPPISTSDPSANECKLVEYRGQKVAAFIISGDTMLCLPQAFELFLKHLVGGLHTVYTKLKRLDIVPLVCNVEQVRILRGLGAIQPGVNRCKLLSCKDFDVLYRDCTTARCLSIKPPESNSLQFRSSRPGRPPKRGPVGLSLPPTHLSQHPQLKKHRLDNGDFAYENGHISDINRLEKSPLLANGYNPPPMNHMAFMQINAHAHPGTALMSPGMPPHAALHARPDSQMLKAAAQSGMSAANMDALARSGIWENCRAAYEDIVKHLERLREERTDERQQLSMGNCNIDSKPRDLSSLHCSPHRQSPVLNLSKSGGNTDQGSNCDERSEHSDIHSPAASLHAGSIGDAGSRSGGGIIGVEDEDENLSDDNASEVDERVGKEDDDLSETERDNLSTASAQQQHTPLQSSHSHLPHLHNHHAHTMHHPQRSSPSGTIGVSGERSNSDAVATSSLQQSPVAASHTAAAVAAFQHHQRALNYTTLAAAAAVANGANSNASGPVSGGTNEALLAANDANAAAALTGGLALGPLSIDHHLGGAGTPSSTETLLRNIQSLLKVAADNARQQERQLSYEKAELKMDVLREREVKDSLERQLVDERKLRVLYQKRYRRERRIRIRFQSQLDGDKRELCDTIGGNGSNSGAEEGNSNSGGGVTESKSGSAETILKREQDNDCRTSEKSEKSLNSSSAISDTIGSCPQESGSVIGCGNNQTRSSMSPVSQYKQQQQQQQQTQHHQQQRGSSESPNFKREPHSDQEDSIERGRSTERTSSACKHSEPNDESHAAVTTIPTSATIAAAAAASNGKAPWSYPGIDLMATGAFWQNYSESLAELEMERKARTVNVENDVKSSLAERQPAYYKNSVLFGSAN